MRCITSAGVYVLTARVDVDFSETLISSVAHEVKILADKCGSHGSVCIYVATDVCVCVVAAIAC